MDAQEKVEFRLGTEQRVCGPGDVVVIPGGEEREAWCREDTEVILCISQIRVKADNRNQ